VDIDASYAARHQEECMTKRVRHVYQPDDSATLTSLLANMAQLVGTEWATAPDGTIEIGDEDGIAEIAATLAPAGSDEQAALADATWRIAISTEDDADDARARLLWSRIARTPGSVGHDPETGLFLPLPARAETLVVYRPDDVPSVLATELPADAGPRRCMFFVARIGSRATKAAFDAIPEPTIDHTDAGMAVAGRVSRTLARGTGLARVLRPDEAADGARDLGWYDLGFHTSDAAAVERWLRDQGHRLVNARDLFADLLLVVAKRADGERARGLTLRRLVDDRLLLDVLAEIEPGLFAIPAEATRGDRLAFLCDGDIANVAALPASGVLEVQLEHVPVPRRARAAIAAPREDQFAATIARIADRASTAGVTLRAGATPEAVRDAEKALGIALPAEVALFHLAYDGSDGEGVVDGRELLSLERIVDEWQVWKELLDAGDFDGKPIDRTGTGVRDDWWRAEWIPFTYDGAGNHHVLDLAPADDGMHGQVLSFWHDEATRTVVAPSYLAWLADVARWGEGIEPLRAAEMVAEAFVDLPSYTDASGRTITRALHVGAPLDDGAVELTLDARHEGQPWDVRTQPVRLVPSVSVDEARYATFLAGARAAYLSFGAEVFPAELVPAELLEHRDLVTAEDFESAITDPSFVVSRRAVRDLPALGIDPRSIDDALAQRLWSLTPAAVLEGGGTERAVVAALSLEERPDSRPHVARIVELWLARVMERGPHAMGEQPTYVVVMAELEHVLGTEAFTATVRRYFDATR
jgi:cell wall assembly regulator SMI1